MYGWQLGKVIEIITSSTPRLYKKFNVRVVWADSGRGPSMLDLAAYQDGPDADVNSWVFLDPVVEHERNADD